jgi:hypothetical protein
MSRPFSDADPAPRWDASRLAAQFDDQLSRLEALEAESDTRVALRRFVQGDLALSGLSAHVTTLRVARRRASAAARHRAELERKYSSDQPRDDHGRQTSGRAGVGSPAAANPSTLPAGVD